MKQKKSVFIVLISTLLVIMIYWLISVPIINRNKKKDVKIGMQNAERDYDRLSNERANYKSVRSTWESQIQYFDTLSTHVPLKENIKGTSSYIETLDIIRNLADRNNISIEKLNPILENTFPNIEVASRQVDKNVIRYRVEIQCNGNFLSIGKFIEDLQSHKRLINLMKYKIETDYSSKGGLFCELFLNTYVISKN